MISTKIILCAIPKSYWSQDLTIEKPDAVSQTRSSRRKINFPLSSLVKDAENIEKQISRGINLEIDRARYLAVCSSIEALIPSELLLNIANESEFQNALQRRFFPFIEVRADYLDGLSLIMKNDLLEAQKIRVGATFITPDEVHSHSIKFAQIVKRNRIDQWIGFQRRLVFLELACKYGCGIVEIQKPFQKTPYQPNETKEDLHLDDPKVQEIPLDNYPQSDPADLREALRGRVVNALNLPDAQLRKINIGNYPHYIVTEVFHDFVYRKLTRPDSIRSIRIIYSDGSEGKSFPFLCRNTLSANAISELQKCKVIRFGLMSMRHLDLDKDVNAYWFRNQDIQKARTFGETDQFCYELSREQLKCFPTSQPTLIYLFHTGLPSAVIGFYRALVDELLERASDKVTIAVVPYYYRRNQGFIPGKIWG